MKHDTHRSRGLDQLSADIERHRVLGTAASAAFCGFSVPHWRRLYRTNKIPKPMKLGTRKLGWRAGDLVAWIETRTSE